MSHEHTIPGNGRGFLSCWKQTHQIDVEETLIPPSEDRESAIVRWTAPGAYSAIVRGKGGNSGFSLLEIYNLTD